MTNTTPATSLREPMIEDMKLHRLLHLLLERAPTTWEAMPASETRLLERLVFRTTNSNGWVGLAAIPKVPAIRNDPMRRSVPGSLSAIHQKNV